MTTTTFPPTDFATGTASRLRGAADVVSARFSPSWFTPVMGTSIIAVALMTLPVGNSATHAIAALVWVLGATVMIAATSAGILQAVRHPHLAARHHLDPVRAHSYGAPAMGIMSVGAGAYLAGGQFLPDPVALGVFVVLWTVGTAIGLASATVIPYLMFTRHTFESDGAFGGWLMPVVAPMVSASTGALLIEHVGAGQPRLTFTLALGAMFGASLIASIILTTQLWSRMMHKSVPAAAIVPTAWIVLGFLGQSTTATNLLADHTGTVVGPAAAAAAPKLAVAYGVPTMGFAMMWLVIVVLLTRHALRRGMPFTMSWWSFTFPVGTCVTGASGLAAHTGSTALAGLAMALFALLVAGWAVTARRTFVRAQSHVAAAWATA
ncbi:TDT family transporter [Demequina aurantiaca]|uniref:TDT family transporter n=1 Tax=Demequina aurantiaca TaxID=676200 RepID=UPI001364C1DB|nr:TDT family transporter [Demequina aurantiaca]